MKSRCTNPKDKGYRLYGLRGITVCPQWSDSFTFFLADMGLRPSEKHSLERKDSDGNYAPDNCKWATSVEQNNNTSRNVWIHARGERHTAAQWGRVVDTPARIILQRLRRGWSAEDAVYVARANHF